MTVPQGAIAGATFTANNQEIYFTPRGIVQPHGCRLIGVGAVCGLNTNGNTTWRVARFNANAAGTFNDVDYSNGVTKAPKVGINMTTLAVSPGGGGTNTKYNEVTCLGTPGGFAPVWGHGWPSGYAMRSQRLGIGVGTDNAWDTAGVRCVQSATGTFATIHLVRLIFAGMP
jgi:hypothetical protein